MHRRHVLGLTASSLAALAGCASVAHDVADSTGNASSPANATTNGSAPPSTTTTSSDTPSNASNASNSGNDTGSTAPKDFPVKSPDGPVPDAPIPHGGKDSTYAVMGRDDPDVTATLYGNWKCPYTHEFVLTDMQDVVDRYVKHGHLALEYRAVAYRGGDPYLGPDAPRAARAGLAVWNEDPKSYWQYFATVFASQPQERWNWATADQLLKYADAADVGHRDEIRKAIEDGDYSDPVQKSVSDAHDVGVSTVPRLVVDGTVTAPTIDYEHTRHTIERALKN